MTPQKAQIQALINGIDEVLSKNSPRLPWVMSNDALQQRQVLEQTRQYLITLHQQMDEPPLSAGSLPQAAGSASLESPSESAQQVLQAVLQEMNYWRVNMLQPLRSEIDALQRQREILTQELRQLEAQRQQYGSPHQPNQQLLMEFLQSAMAQMQANLSAQVTQMIANLPPQATPALQSAADREAQLTTLSPAERLAQMQKVQAQSDQLMLTLDSTLQVIFESLNRNVQTYQESLEQGLNRMHGLGQQGEAMFAFLVNRLAQQIGREASSFLQSSAAASQTTAAQTPAAHPTAPALPTPSQPDDTTLTVADFLSEAPPQPEPVSFVPAVPFDLSEEVLDISELDLTEAPLPAADNLDALDRELSQLDLSPITTEVTADADAFDLFSGDQPLTHLDTETSQPAADWQTEPAKISDLDSALDLLNQLSAEMQAEMALDETPIAPPPTAAELSIETELIATPDSLYDEAFYNNLFDEVSGSSNTGDVATPPPSATAPIASTEDAINIDAFTLEQEWFGGLGDPAMQPEAAPVAQPEFPNNTVSQSLETFLLNNGAASPAASADLFSDFSASSPAPSEALAEPTPPKEPETIASLAELVPDQDTETPFEWPDISSFEVETPALTSEEAAPEETLSVTEAPVENFNALDMTIDALDQLGSPISDRLETSPTSPTDSAAESTPWDLFTDVPNPAQESLSSSESLEPPTIPPPITIEGLESLFESLPAPTETEPTSDLPNDLFDQFSSPPAASATSAEPTPDEAPSDSEKKNRGN